MSRFGSDPLSFFEGVYREPPPWDIGAPQPDMTALLAEFPPEGPVLDAGCGTGDLAIYLAESGLETLGIDFVEEAIAEAKRRRVSLPPVAAAHLDFQVADALHPSGLGRTFGSVVDSGFYHLFEPDEGELYAGELARVLRPGGRLYLHEFAVSFPVPNVPRAVSVAEVQERFTPDKGWQVLTIRTGEFLSRFDPVPATLACIEYVGQNVV